MWLTTLALTLALAAPSHEEASARYGYSVAVPASWHRSRARLVPRLLMPREILSLGNFGMRVGGGGNCGREPAASIRSMRPGDALITIQEVEVTPRLRAYLTQSFPSRPRPFGLGGLDRGAYAPASASRQPVRFWKLAFSDRGRAFELLAYVDGPPTPGLRAEVHEILEGLRFS